MEKLASKKKFKKKCFKKFWTLHKKISGHKETVSTIDFDSKNNTLLTGSKNGLIYIWKMSTSKNISILKGHNGAINCSTMNKKNSFLFTGGQDQLVRCWDVEYNKNLRNFHGHYNSITDLVFHPILNIFFSSSEDHTIRLWDLRTHKAIRILNFHSRSVTAMISNGESPHLISGGLDNNIFLWDFVGGKPLACLRINDEGINQFSNCSSDFFFSILTTHSITFLRKDGLFLKKFKSQLQMKSHSSFRRNNEFVIGSQCGHVSTFKLDHRNANLNFVQNSNLHFDNAKSAISIVAFDKSGDNIYVGRESADLMIFKKKWMISEI